MVSESYEVRDGKLWVNGEVVPLLKGVVSAVLLGTDFEGRDGPIPTDLARRILALDRRISLDQISSQKG